MGYLRFWRRVRVAPGVTVNLGKRGVSSVSVGVRGAHYTVGRNGKRRMTVGVPGTGLFYTQQKQASWRQHGQARPGRLLPLWLLLLICMLLFFWLATTQTAAFVATVALFPVGAFVIWALSQRYRREIQRATGAVVDADVWEIIRGPTEYGARVIDRSANLPVIILTHDGWQGCATDVWDILRTSGSQRGRRSREEAAQSHAVDLACIDIAQPSNATILPITDGIRANLPYLTFMIRGRMDQGILFSGFESASLPGAVAGVLNRAIEAFYGASA